MTRPRPRPPTSAAKRAAALLLVLAASALAPVRAQPAAEGACTLVYGHGRNVSDDDPAANRSWDEANHAMASQVAAVLAGSGRRVVRVLLPVTMTDVPAIGQGLLQRALQQGCGRIVESTLFADEHAGLLVARLRAYAVEPARGPRQPARIGQTLYTHQQEFEHSQRNLDRLAPAALGEQLAADYLARQRAP